MVQILDDIILEDSTIGYIIGNNIKAIDFSKNEELDNFITNIKKLECKDISKVYIEGCKEFDCDTIKKVEEKTDYSFAIGDKIRIHNIEILLKKLPGLFNRELDKNNLLIVSSSRERLIDIIKKLPTNLNCIASLGISEDNLYTDILKETGVSIYQPYKVDKAIKKFHIIINYGEEVYFDINRIRNQCIILDFSMNRSLSAVNGLNKNIIYIEDFNYPSKLNSNWIDDFIDSRLYESIYKGKIERFSQVYVQGHYWYLNKYINGKIKKRGRL